MSKKYVIEIKPEYEDSFKGLMILGAKDSNLFVDALAVDDIEELNSDYINEHFSDLQDTAYQRGLEDGKKAFDLLDAERDSKYQRGLDDAWKAAGKIADMWTIIDNDELLAIFGITERIGHSTIRSLFEKQTANEAIEKLKAYEEQKENEEIKVGDIIANNTEPKLKVWVTYFDEIGFCGTAITDFGTVDEGQLYTSCSPKGWHKIGHFDIDKILEEMNE